MKSYPAIQTRRVSIPTSRIIEILKQLHARHKDDGAGYLASAVTYYGFLALFPLMLLGFSITGFLLAGNPDLQHELTRRISESVPGVGPLIGKNLETLQESRATSGLLGLAGLIWAGLGVTEASRFALGKVFRRPEPEGLLKVKLQDLGALALLGTIALAATALAGVVGGLRAGGPIGIALRITGGLIAFGLDFLLFMLAYRILIAGKGPGWRELWPGALLAAVGWLVLKLAGSWYATRTAANASEVYGTFAATLAILVMLFLAARLFLYGAELNAVLMGGPEPSKR